MITSRCVGPAVALILVTVWDLPSSLAQPGATMEQQPRFEGGRLDEMERTLDEIDKVDRTLDEIAKELERLREYRDKDVETLRELKAPDPSNSSQQTVVPEPVVPLPGPVPVPVPVPDRVITV